MKSTNYFDTFITVSRDYPTAVGKEPDTKPQRSSRGGYRHVARDFRHEPSHMSDSETERFIAGLAPST
ncbi:MAG: hypothetical protein C3F11_15665 [Methylocystaceae bacterium]|nr:MAG: hypothetical protein C3F11_15665 [Methylocystaceae bacterium]